jgi:hypothetical protein
MTAALVTMTSKDITLVGGGVIKGGENNAVYETYRIHISCCTAFSVVITPS